MQKCKYCKKQDSLKEESIELSGIRFAGGIMEKPPSSLAASLFLPFNILSIRGWTLPEIAYKVMTHTKSPFIGCCVRCDGCCGIIVFFI
jgi:hypothetical protein